MDWIDAHCHLADRRLEPFLDEVLERSRACGVTGWIQGGVGPDDWERQGELRRRLGNRFLCAVGLHPWWVAEADDGTLRDGLTRLEKALPEAPLLGETGLDRMPRHAGQAAFRRQQAAFEAQLDLARVHRKPVVLHVVRAHNEALGILRPRGPLPHGGIVHSFQAGWDIARHYLDLGLMLSLCGYATRPGAPFADAVKRVPLDRIVLETDAPDQVYALPRFQGLNEPGNLPAVAHAVARLRGKETAEEILAAATRNLKGWMTTP